MCQKRYALLSIALSLLASLSPCYGQDRNYAITESELNQIQTECANLRLQIASLNDSHSNDSLLLDSLNQQLQILTQKESDEKKLLAESNLQLEALSASLKQSKKEALWLTVKVGAVSLGIGAAAGAFAALLID